MKVASDESRQQATSQDMETRLTLVGRHTLAESIEVKVLESVHVTHSFKSNIPASKTRGTTHWHIRRPNANQKCFLRKCRLKINTTIYENHSVRHTMQLKLTPALRKRETRRKIK